MTSQSLVSCIMPTRNRRAFITQSIWYFLRQDYPEKELIIVDDGTDAIGDLLPEDERIRYIRLEHPATIGEKRNIACQASCGEFIAHWDDDDWYAPERLSTQVAALRDTGALLCGVRQILYYHLAAGEAWLFEYPTGMQPWLAGSSLLYQKDAWRGYPFPSQNGGEAADLVRRLPTEKVYTMPLSDIYICLIHSRNTVSQHPSPPYWQRCPIQELNRLMASDSDFYAAMRLGQEAYTPAARSPQRAMISVAAPFMVYDGYGSMAEYLVLSMENAGVTVNVIPMDLDLAETSSEFQAIYRRSRPGANEPLLYFCWPRPELERLIQAPDLFINTMWESNQLPAGWAGRLNRARAVIVPTRFVADVCRKSNVTVPIEVVPEGIDPSVYHYMERPERETFTTLIVGTMVGRKHTREGVAAWKAAFADDPHARLIIKSRFSYRNYQPDDERIQFVDSNEATRGIAHWYSQADVLLALGSEGFGLPLVEAMATGLPAIALDSEGQSDTCSAAKSYLLPVEPRQWEVADELPFGPAGMRGVPNVAEVAEQLRWVRAHRSEAADLGRTASVWARQERDIWRKGPAVVEIMERYVHPARPLSRLNTFWVRSWRTACGVAEYTAHLARALPRVQVTDYPGDIARLRLLHIQHEPSLYSDTDMFATVQRIRRAQVPVIVTEHAVLRGAQAWEREADMLVAHTSRGTQMLRHRWPNKPVEHIPHGCPTWFPPRKRRRGRVIGAFGFLEPHKGFWRLLDVLKAVPNTNLILYSYAKTPERAQTWEQAAAGLPVLRHTDFQSPESVAQRLAAEADILVFWYDEVSHASASGAVRIGLATGVPVLASPTSWFEELSQVTYQPEDLVTGVTRLLEDTRLRKELNTAAREYCEENSWAHTANRHSVLWEAVGR